MIPRRFYLRDVADIFRVYPQDVLDFYLNGKIVGQVNHKGKWENVPKERIEEALARNDKPYGGMLNQEFSLFPNWKGPIFSLCHLSFAEIEINRIKTDSMFKTEGKPSIKSGDQESFLFVPGQSIAFLAAQYKTSIQWIVRGIIEAELPVYILGDRILNTLARQSVEECSPDLGGKWIRVDDRENLKSVAYNGIIGHNSSSFSKGTSQDGKVFEVKKYPGIYLFWDKVYIAEGGLPKFSDWVNGLHSKKIVSSQKVDASDQQQKNNEVLISPITAANSKNEIAEKRVATLQTSDLPQIDEIAMTVSYNGKIESITQGIGAFLLELCKYLSENPKKNGDFEAKKIIARAKDTRGLSKGHRSIDDIFRTRQAAKELLFEPGDIQGFWKLKIST